LASSQIVVAAGAGIVTGINPPLDLAARSQPENKHAYKIAMASEHEKSKAASGAESSHFHSFADFRRWTGSAGGGSGER
jgi:hypothetical protein